jgi:hypothetical protein
VGKRRKWLLIKWFEYQDARLKIPVSAVRFCPWAPSKGKGPSHHEAGLFVWFEISVNRYVFDQLSLTPLIRIVLQLEDMRAQLFGRGSCRQGCSWRHRVCAGGIYSTSLR